MLHSLHIENIAVIERAEIEFSEGLNVFTGETGAGKSIIIDSIGAVLGDRVGRSLVRTGAEKGVVTAVFESREAENWLSENDIDCDGEIIISRRITAEGKGSCKVCGMPITTAQLKELGALLCDIHGQNDGRQLVDERRHLSYLDAFGETEKLHGEYAEQYRKYLEIRREMKKLRMDEVEKERLSDSLRYQIAELERAELKAGEYDALCSRRDLLRNSEKLTEAMDEALSALIGGDENALSYVSNASYYAAKAANYVPELSEAAKGIDEASFALSNAAELLRDFRDNLDFSPEEYDELERRIAQLNKLTRKYAREEDELIPYLEECRRKLDEIEYADERLVKLEKECRAQIECCRVYASRLSALRQEKARELEKRITAELRGLSMPSVRFAVELTPLAGETGFDESGADAVRFLMSANAGEELGRISKIASGGELSRIMLAMKNVFAEHDPVGTMVFDEIDTGVSGIAAQRVAEKLYAVSTGKQVMCVTHLPQIAAMADEQYRIKKEEQNGRTYTKVVRLSAEGRAEEIARLFGGDVVTELTLAGAKEQMAAAASFKAKSFA